MIIGQNECYSTNDIQGKMIRLSKRKQPTAPRTGSTWRRPTSPSKSPSLFVRIAWASPPSHAEAHVPRAIRLGGRLREETLVDEGPKATEALPEVVAPPSAPHA